MMVPADSTMPTERLQKVLAAAGVASRRASENLIVAGRVTVNGDVVTELGTRVDPSVDRITVDGRPVQVDVTMRYIMLRNHAYVPLLTYECMYHKYICEHV